MSGFLPNSYPLARHRDSSNQRHRGTVTARETPTGLSSLLHPTSSLSRPSQPLYNLPSLASGLGPQKSDISRDAWDDDFPNNLRSSDSSIARYTLPSFSPSRANARSLPSLNFSDTGVNSSSLRTPSTMSSPYTTSTSNGRFACRCGKEHWVRLAFHQTLTYSSRTRRHSRLVPSDMSALLWSTPSDMCAGHRSTSGGCFPLHRLQTLCTKFERHGIFTRRKLLKIGLPELLARLLLLFAASAARFLSSLPRL